MSRCPVSCRSHCAHLSLSPLHSGHVCAGLISTPPPPAPSPSGYVSPWSTLSSHLVDIESPTWSISIDFTIHDAGVRLWRRKFLHHLSSFEQKTRPRTEDDKDDDPRIVILHKDDPKDKHLVKVPTRPAFYGSWTERRRVLFLGDLDYVIFGCRVLHQELL